MTRPAPMRTVLMLVAVVALVAGCDAPAESGGQSVRVVAVAGPTCPVVSDPPDPNCADRPVAGAGIVVRDADGSEVARLVTDAEGAAVVELLPGRYVIEPQPVDGMMGTAGPVEVMVLDNVVPAAVIVAYDTGIR